MADAHVTWDEEADVVVVGYGFAGATAAITAHDAGANVLLLEKAPEPAKGGNSRVNAQILFWPDDIENAKIYFKALAGPYMGNIPEEVVHVWATEMHANRAWLEGLDPRYVAEKLKDPTHKVIPPKGMHANHGLGEVDRLEPGIAYSRTPGKWELPGGLIEVARGSSKPQWENY